LLSVDANYWAAPASFIEVDKWFLTPFSDFFGRPRGPVIKINWQKNRKPGCDSLIWEMAEK